MRIRRLWIVLGIVLVPAAAFADDHKAFFGGLSLVNDSTLTGFRLSFTGKPKDGNLHLVGDFSTQSGTHEGFDVRRTTFMGGVRLDVIRRTQALMTGQQATEHPKHLVAVHALVGGVRDSSGDDAVTDGALAVGASYDFVARRFASGAAVGIQVQADYITRLGDADAFPRFSVGGVYWFKD